MYLDQITYVDHGDDPAAALAALASDQVDLIYEGFVEQLEVIGSLPNVHLFEAVTAQTGVARMQMDKKPFDDIRVRTAVRLCQDHQRLLDIAYRGKGSPAEDHHVAPVHPEYAKLPAQKQDYARAKKLLADAGYPNGIDLKIDCKKTPSWGAGPGPGPGRDVQAGGHPHADKTSCRTPSTGRYGTRLPSASPPGPTVRSESWCLTLATARACRGTRATTTIPPSTAPSTWPAPPWMSKERRKEMAKVEKILQDDGVIAQPLWRSVFAAGHKRVQGYELHPTIYHQLSKVWIA